MRKILVGFMAVALVASAVHAGNLYQNHSVVTVVTNTLITGATTASNTIGVATIGYPGTGNMLLQVNTGAGVISAQLYTSATSNGVETASVNQPTTGMSWTNYNNFVSIPFTPNKESGYSFVTFTSSAAVTGSVSAVFIATSK